MSIQSNPIQIQIHSKSITYNKWCVLNQKVKIVINIKIIKVIVRKKAEQCSKFNRAVLVFSFKPLDSKIQNQFIIYQSSKYFKKSKLNKSKRSAGASSCLECLPSLNFKKFQISTQNSKLFKFYSNFLPYFNKYLLTFKSCAFVVIISPFFRPPPFQHFQINFKIVKK